jgi:hypothetical protein
MESAAPGTTASAVLSRPGALPLLLRLCSLGGDTGDRFAATVSEAVQLAELPAAVSLDDLNAVIGIVSVAVAVAGGFGGASTPSWLAGSSTTSMPPAEPSRPSVRCHSTAGRAALVAAGITCGRKRQRLAAPRQVRVPFFASVHFL